MDDLFVLIGNWVVVILFVVMVGVLGCNIITDLFKTMDVLGKVIEVNNKNISVNLISRDSNIYGIYYKNKVELGDTVIVTVREINDFKTRYEAVSVRPYAKNWMEGK